MALFGKKQAPPSDVKQNNGSAEKRAIRDVLAVGIKDGTPKYMQETDQQTQKWFHTNQGFAAVLKQGKDGDMSLLASLDGRTIGQMVGRRDKQGKIHGDAELFKAIVQQVEAFEKGKSKAELAYAYKKPYARTKFTGKDRIAAAAAGREAAYAR